MNKFKKILSILLSILFLCLPNYKIAKANEDNYVKPVKISAGNRYSMAIGDDGNLYTWGDNSCGQLGNGTYGQLGNDELEIYNFCESTPQKIELGNGVKPVWISAGYLHSMAIGDDGNLYTWGDNSYGQLGNGKIGYYESKSTPQKIELGNGVKPVKISAGGSHSMAIGDDGNLYTWGDNYKGQLGNGTYGQLGNDELEIYNFCESTPQKIELGNGVKPVWISAGYDFSMAIGDDGNLYTWGDNSYGQLGNGKSGLDENEVTPQKIELGNGVKPVKISAGCGHSMAIGDDGNLYTWGDNYKGQLGNGKIGYYESKSTPQKIELGNGVKPVEISAGYDFSMAIGDDGNLYTWGHNEYGQLGNGKIGEDENEVTPQKIELGNGVKPVKISAGNSYSMAIGDDGNLYTLGYNSWGELGNGYEYIDMHYAPIPQKIILNTNKSGNEEKSEPQISYRTHVQKQGWQNYVSSGQTSGTEGKALRLEGINIKLSNSGYKGDILYKTHVQKIGWQNWVKNGAMSGTEGRALRLEAIQIKLTDELAEKYDIYYRVHAQHFGWLGWAKNGASSGTAGYGYRLEAIQIQLVPKGENINGSTSNCFKQK